MVDLLQDWPVGDFKSFDDSLRSVRVMCKSFPKACMHPDTDAAYLTLVKEDSLDYGSLESEMVDLLEGDNLPLGYRPAYLMDFKEPMLPDGYYLPITERWFMHMSVVYDHMFCWQLKDDQKLCEMFKTVTAKEPNVFNHHLHADQVSLKMTLERAMLGRINYEIDHVKCILLFFGHDIKEMPSWAKVTHIEPAIDQAEYMLALLSSWPGCDLIEEHVETLSSFTNELEQLKDQYDQESI
jgi:hypothetical protein